MAGQSFWLTFFCVVCFVVIVVEIKGNPTNSTTAAAAVTAVKRNATIINNNNSKNKTGDAGGSDESCDLEPEPEAEAEPEPGAHGQSTNSTKSGNSTRQPKELNPTDKDKYGTHGGAPEPEPEGQHNGTKVEPLVSKTNSSSTASANNQGSKPGQDGHEQKGNGTVDTPTAGKSTADNSTSSTSPSSPSDNSGSGSLVTVNFASVALLLSLLYFRPTTITTN